jgi:PII-like signaling protein
MVGVISPRKAVQADSIASCPPTITPRIPRLITFRAEEAEEVVLFIGRMKDVTAAKLLRIHIGELDRARHRPLFEVLVNEARATGLSGATVLRGIESFGASSVVHRSRLLELSEDLPIVVEIVDAEEKIRGYLERIDPILEEAGCGVLITMEKVEILRWTPKTSR